MTNPTLHMPRSRGALAGLLLILLGAWGALVPVIGPLYDYAYAPGAAWTATTGRWILQILPGAAVVLGGVLLMVTGARAIGLAAGALAAAGGAWFVLGPVLSRLWDPTGGLQGQPLGSGVGAVVEEIGIFTGLGVVIVFLAAVAMGRFTMRGHRDAAAIEAARQRRAQRDRAHRVTATVPGPGPAGVGAAPAVTRDPVAVEDGPHRSPDPDDARRVASTAPTEERPDGEPAGSGSDGVDPVRRPDGGA